MPIGFLDFSRRVLCLVLTSFHNRASQPSLFLWLSARTSLCAKMNPLHGEVDSATAQNAKKALILLEEENQFVVCIYTQAPIFSMKELGLWSSVALFVGFYNGTTAPRDCWALSGATTKGRCGDGIFVFGPFIGPIYLYWKLVCICLYCPQGSTLYSCLLKQNHL